MWLGALGTVAYLGIAGYLAFTSETDIRTLPPNELGDLLAGAFAPLAFLWLVLGYFQQQRELRLNTEALLMQASELAQSVILQSEMVEVTNLQLARDRPSFVIDPNHLYEYDGEVGENAPVVRMRNVGGPAHTVILVTQRGLKLDYPPRARFQYVRWPSAGVKRYYISDTQDDLGGTLRIDFKDPFGRAGSQVFVIAESHHQDPHEHEGRSCRVFVFEEVAVDAVESSEV